MKSFKIVTFFAILIIISSCKHDDDISVNENDYLIFGHFYGECIGEGCVETYKLTDTKLFEDTNDSYAGTAPFNFIELGALQFEQVKDLIDFLPPELLNASDTAFGCPDCADQGGLFIQYLKNGNTKSWRIDQSKNQVPEYLYEFMDKVNEKISLINN